MRTIFLNIIRSSLKYIKMSSKPKESRIKENMVAVNQTMTELKSELNVLNREFNVMLSKQLQEENRQLIASIEEARQRLVNIEVQNGVKQIPVPNQTTVNASSEKSPSEKQEINPDNKPEETAKLDAKPKKEKKPKEPKLTVPITELPIDVGRLDLRVAKVEDVQRHPDADSLYVLKINCGEAKPRTVCSGLVKHVPIEELQNRSVLLLCNLKPVKMRGITSEAMVMCASSEAGVEVLLPPNNCQPGELVHCSGFTRQPDAVMNPKKKIFETVAPDLHTNDALEACYKGVRLEVPEKGFFVSKSLKNVPVK